MCAEFIQLNCEHLFPPSLSGEQLVFCNVHQAGHELFMFRGRMEQRQSGAPTETNQNCSYLKILYFLVFFEYHMCFSLLTRFR